MAIIQVKVAGQSIDAVIDMKMNFGESDKCLKAIKPKLDLCLSEHYTDEADVENFSVTQDNPLRAEFTAIVEQDGDEPITIGGTLVELVVY